MAVRALLGFVALWPVATLVLQLGWSVDPWKLMGFGMYAAPGRRLEDVQLALSVKRDGAWQPLDQTAVEEESARFIRSRRTFGRLASPDELGLAMRAATKAESARVEVRWVRLDARTARVVLEREVVELP
jgi:hypothetical protein